MTIFAILMPRAQPELAASIQSVYPNGDHFQLSDTQWLVSSKETVTDVSNKIGMTSPLPDFVPKGLGVIFATSSYFGRAPTTVWDWIKVKLEGVPGG
jgi:hypothetical protein